MCRSGGRRCPSSRTRANGGTRGPALAQPGDTSAPGGTGTPQPPASVNYAAPTAHVGIQGDTVHVGSITINDSGVHVTPAADAGRPAGNGDIIAIQGQNIRISGQQLNIRGQVYATKTRVHGGGTTDSQPAPGQGHAAAPRRDAGAARDISAVTRTVSPDGTVRSTYTADVHGDIAGVVITERTGPVYGGKGHTCTGTDHDGD